MIWLSTHHHRFFCPRTSNAETYNRIVYLYIVSEDRHKQRETYKSRKRMDHHQGICDIRDHHAEELQYDTANAPDKTVQFPHTIL